MALLSNDFTYRKLKPNSTANEISIDILYNSLLTQLKNEETKTILERDDDTIDKLYRALLRLDHIIVL